MTIYTGYILLGKSYQYDMNVVHYRRHDMFALSIYIYKKCIVLTLIRRRQLLEVR